MKKKISIISFLYAALLVICSCAPMTHAEYEADVKRAKMSYEQRILCAEMVTALYMQVPDPTALLTSSAAAAKVITLKQIETDYINAKKELDAEKAETILEYKKRIEELDEEIALETDAETCSELRKERANYEKELQKFLKTPDLIH